MYTHTLYIAFSVDVRYFSKKLCIKRNIKGSFMKCIRQKTSASKKKRTWDENINKG